jgi:hypothetical protein
MNEKDIERDARAQAEAVRAEHAGLPAGGDARVDRYRLIVRALREPVLPELPAGFAARVAARLERAPAGGGFEERVTGILVSMLGIVALVFAGPICFDALRILLATVLATPALQSIAAAGVCIGAVWLLDRGWSRSHSAGRAT